MGSDHFFASSLGSVILDSGQIVGNRLEMQQGTGIWALFFPASRAVVSIGTVRRALVAERGQYVLEVLIHRLALP